MKKVVIIGAGISGLCAGIYLLQNEYEVEIYEKNSYAGGFLTSWVRKGNIIDGCLHWMLGTKNGTKLNKIWDNVAGINDLEIIKTKSFYDTYLDGEVFHMYNDFDLLEAELYKFSDKDDEEIKKMMDAIRALGVSEIPSDLPYELEDPSNLKPNKELLRKTIGYIKLSVKDLSERFNSKIIRYAILNSLVNEKFSAYYFLTTLGNLCSGNASLPKGGSHTLRDRMVNRFKTLGGNLYLNSDVSKIIIENDTAKGIIVNNKNIYADYVISANDIHNVFNVLLDNKYEFSPYKEMDKDVIKYPPYSFIISTFKTKYKFDESICRIYKVKPYKILGKEYDYLSIRAYSYDDTLVNGEYTSVQVMLTTFNDEFNYIKNLSKEEYLKMKDDISNIYKFLLESLFNSQFILIDTLTPLTYLRYNNSYKGNFMTYALAPKVSQYIRSQKIDGLNNFYLANQWMYLPGGTPAAVVFGKFAAQLVLNDDNKNYKL